jgi:AcrR family transcriptional regulator
MSETSNRQTLSVRDWAEAALEVIAEKGIKGIAVEPLARRLGVTKGSFYWHFANRRALLQAALDLWEHQQTDEILDRVAQESDPRRRLARVFAEADGSRYAGRLYLALAGATENTLIQSVVRRVIERQTQFLWECYRDLGLDGQAARHKAVLAYSVFMGTLELRRDAPDTLPAGEAFHDYMHFVGEALIPGYERALHRREQNAPSEGGDMAPVPAREH